MGQIPHGDWAYHDSDERDGREGTNLQKVEPMMARQYGNLSLKIFMAAAHCPKIFQKKLVVGCCGFRESNQANRWNEWDR